MSKVESKQNGSKQPDSEPRVKVAPYGAAPTPAEPKVPAFNVAAYIMGLPRGNDQLMNEDSRPNDICAAVAVGSKEDAIIGLLDSVRRGLVFLDVVLQGGGCTTPTPDDLIEHVCDLEKRTRAAIEIYRQLVWALSKDGLGDWDGGVKGYLEYEERRMSLFKHAAKEASHAAEAEEAVTT